MPTTEPAANRQAQVTEESDWHALVEEMDDLLLNGKPLRMWLEKNWAKISIRLLSHPAADRGQIVEECAKVAEAEDEVTVDPALNELHAMILAGHGEVVRAAIVATKKNIARTIRNIALSPAPAQTEE